MLLSGCANQSITTETQNQYPPQAYLTPCEQSQFNGNTYGDVVEFLMTVTQERDICALQIQQIRDWITEKQSEQK